jgi:enoyl-CoA hydratase
LFRNNVTIKVRLMSTRVSYELDGPVATIAMDDGKVNALSLDMQRELGDAFDRAEADGAVVVLTGRDGVFSAGFDLGVLRSGGEDALAMLRGGFELAERMLSFPTPVVIACSGHTIAMGVFVLLSADYRLGVAGAAHRIVANEVAIGLTMPRAAIEICRQRLAPAHLERAVLLAETYAPDDAVAAGFLDRVVPAGELLAAAHEVARGLTALDLGAHAASKRRMRAPMLAALRTAIEDDDAALRAGG